MTHSDSSCAPVTRTKAVALAAALLATLLPGSAQAVIRVDSSTTVASIEFRFDEEQQSVEEDDLRKQMRLAPVQVPSEWRRVVAALPFVPDGTKYRLEPLTLQEDVVRLRRLLNEAGMPYAAVRYELKPADEPNSYDLTMVIDEGPMLQVRGVHFTSAAGDSFVPPERDKDDFDRTRRRVERNKQRYAALAERQALQARIVLWWKNRGYAAARVEVTADVDSARVESDVRIMMDPGIPSVFGELTVEGNKSIKDEIVLRELPFKTGDPYRPRDLAEGQRSVQSLDIVRVAFVDGAADSANPGQVPVNVRVSEAKPRLITGQIGYGTEIGAAGDVSWSHRNFTGGARVLTYSGSAETGWGALIDDPESRYYGSVTIRQPYVWDRRLSFVTGPFIELRDDYRDRSWEAGANATLVFEAAPLRTAALSYEGARREILDDRIGEVSSGDTDFLTFLEQLAQGDQIDRGELTLTGTWATLEEPNPRRRAAVVRPFIRVSTPSGMNDREYARLDLTVSGYEPVTRRIGFAGRVTAGRIFPFGKSLPAPGEGSELTYVRLRDVAFTAGGQDDVRGWGNRLLGPKFPDVRFREDGDSLVAFTDGYVPMGGLSRVSATAEVRFPFPGLAREWGTHAFLDAGRVWTADERYAFPIAEDEDQIFYGTGVGINYTTAVGAIGVSVGYKINPSLLDLADADDVLQVLLDERPAESLDTHEIRRWQFHLSFGSQF